MYFGKIVVFGCIRAKVVVYWQKWLYSGKSGCIRAEVVVIGQKGLYSRKSGSIRAKVIVFGQRGCIRAKRLYSGNVVF